MYKSLFLFMIFIVNVGFSQKEIDINQKNAKQAVLDFFEGFHQGDTTRIRKTMDATIVMQTIVKTKEGTTKILKTDVNKFLEVIHNRPEDQRWLEKLLGFKIDADTSIAQVWTPYKFYVNDKFSHCGVNMFQLFNDGNSWKIIAIVDTRKKDGCK
ncbi:nuclear transport factor 2 family protein [Aquimarina sp. M1]